METKNSENKNEQVAVASVIGSPKFIPILFSTEMVQAILRGDKTQTRRIVKPQPDDSGLWNDSLFPRSLDSTLKGWNGTVDSTGEDKEFKCKFGTEGDILWVRETYAKTININSINNWPNRPHINIDEEESKNPYSAIIWRADGNWQWCDDDGFYSEKSYWKPSIFMPKEACRIFLKVKSVRVERLQDISRGDAMGEGCPFPNIAKETNPVAWFAGLWQKINGFKSWNDNPFVWAIEFERIERPTGFL